MKVFKCQKCGVEKPITEFHKRKTIQRGHTNKCVSCASFEAKERYRKDPSKTIARVQRWNKAHPGKAAARSKEWAANNPEKVKSNSARRSKRQRVADNLRSRIRHLIKRGKMERTGSAQLIGCSRSKLMSHIENQFEPGMNWGNYGQWHIDHIIPVKVFNLKCRDQVMRCFHWTNLRPLWASENLKKGTSVPVTQLSILIPE